MPLVSTRWTEDHAAPLPPVEVADAVELWARQYGRHATLKYVPAMKCWSVNLTLPAGHPDLGRWQKEGSPGDAPTEGVVLIEWDATAGTLNPTTGKPAGEYRAVNLEEYGAVGVVGLLEKGNTWSGRGEFASLQDAVVQAATRNRAEKEKVKAQGRQWAGDYAKDVRRSVLKIPYLPVGIALGTEVDTHAGNRTAVRAGDDSRGS
jgi:hypothetical protein